MNKRKKTALQVMVYDYAGNPIFDAKVTLQPSKDKTLRAVSLKFDRRMQVYRAGDVLPGNYVLKVQASGFEPDERNVLVRYARLSEIFVLGKAGMPRLHRGRVRVPFEPQPNLLAVALDPRVAEKEERKLIDFAVALKLKAEEIGANIRKNGIRVFRFPAGTSDESKLRLQARLAEQPLIQYAGPIVRIDKQSLSFLTNTIIVRFKSHIAKDEVYSLAKKFRLTVLRHIPYAGNAFQLSIEGPVSLKILDLCAEIIKTNKVEYAEPDIYGTAVDDQISPTDYLFPEQWHAALVRLPDAWQLLANLNPNDTFGSPNIIIAVADSGVDVNNPDFNSTVTNGAPKIYELFDFANMVANNNNRPSNHGTGCAGAATALANNSSPIPGQNEGIAGVAGNCRLMGISRSGPESRYSDAYVWIAGFDPHSGTLGFPTQISPGADIITNSFGYNSGLPISGLMEDTFDFLTTYGRGGKGVLLFFSVGNYAVPVDYTLRRPWAAYEKTFAIAASTLANDGVTEVFSAYSGFGGLGIVDLCAPSQDEYVGERSLHNPPQNYGAVTCDEVGNGNLPSHPAVQTTLSQSPNAAPFTTLTATSVIGATTLNVASNAGFTVNQWIRIGQHGDDAAEWVSVTAIAGATQLSVTACANAHSTGSPIFGATTISVTNNTGFAAGRWLLLEQPGQPGAEACLIRQIPAGTTRIIIAGPLHNHWANAPVITGPNDYRNSFGGTSFSTPVCAGVAALILSANPELNWVRVRDILRTTATHIDAANTNPIGQWIDTDGDGVADYSRWYGYGRVNAQAAVQEAINLIGVGAPASIDTWIRENSTDIGDVPCPPPYSPDVWVRNSDPLADDPAHITEHQEPIRGQDNWVYVNVRNRGMLDSQDVYVRIYITRWAGTQYVYPTDFIPTNPPGTTPTLPLAPGTYLIDEIHINSIPAGGVVSINTVWPTALIPPASVTISGVSYSWADACLLVEISPHDGPTPTGNNTWDNNNLCQKNVFPIDPGDSDSLAIGFVVGHRDNVANLLNLRIVRRKLPADVKLYFDYSDKITAKSAQKLFGYMRDKNVLTTCDMTILSEANAELRCPKSKTKSHVVIVPQTRLVIPCCHPCVTTGKYQLYPTKESPTVFELPIAQTSFVPMPREKGEYQVAALRLKGLKRLKKGQYHIDIYQEDLDGKLEGGINFIIEKRSR